MDEEKKEVPQPPVSASALTTPLMEDAKTVESKEKEQPVHSLEQKASELAHTNPLSGNVSQDAGQDQASTSDDKADGQKDQFWPRGSCSDKDVESVVKTVVDRVSKERDEKDHGLPQIDAESSDNKVMEKVHEGVAEMKLIEKKDGVDTSKMIDEEKPSGMNETTEVIKSEEKYSHADDLEKKDNETVDMIPMNVDMPPSAHEQVKSIVDVREGEKDKSPIKNEDHDSKEEEMYRNDDWDFPPSDSEDGNFTSEPPPHMIIELYEKLAKEEVLNLEWTCLGRRTPEEEVQEMEVEDASKDSQEEMVNKPVEEDPTEFDFDIDTMMQNKVTPRRMAVFDQGGSGSAKKRVAQMDRVINDLRRFSKINEEMVKTGDATPPAPTNLEVTPQRPLGKFHIRRDLHQ